MREYLEQKYFAKNDISFSDFLAEKKATQRDRDTMLSFMDELLKFFTKDNTYFLINGLLESMKSLPILTVYLAIILDDYQIDELGKWFRENLHPELIMEVHCNPALVSGCAYIWKGKYHDFSLHYFISKKQEIINKIIQAYATENI